MVFFIIAGLILLLAGGGWFAGAITVGWILLIAGIVTTVLPFVLFGGLAAFGAWLTRR